MYNNWKQGIPCHITRKERIADLNAMIDIDSAISENRDRKKRINEMMGAMRKL